VNQKDTTAQAAMTDHAAKPPSGTVLSARREASRMGSTGVVVSEEEEGGRALRCWRALPPLSLSLMVPPRGPSSMAVEVVTAATAAGTVTVAVAMMKHRGTISASVSSNTEQTSTVKRVHRCRFQEHRAVLRLRRPTTNEGLRGCYIFFI